MWLCNFGVGRGQSLICAALGASTKNGQLATNRLANIFSLAQVKKIVASELRMTFMTEQRVRMILGGAMLTGFVLSALTLASLFFHWPTLGRAASLPLGVGFLLTSLSIWLSARWLRRRQLPL